MGGGKIHPIFSSGKILVPAPDDTKNAAHETGAAS